MIIALEVDGTIEVGNPPGPITVETLASIAKLRYPSVIIVSDDYPKVLDRTDLSGHLIPAVGLERAPLAEKLKTLRALFPDEGRYIMVGVSNEAMNAAKDAGYEYMAPSQFLELLQRGELP
ncbi:MAG: hypothetical protein NZ957_02445 [Thaumarchaeota archaeon]|nr:hypothetical protein [Candidatus Calditenuaceae archaeon]